jgi:DNA repair protein RecO (recombination protein O)
MEQWTDRGIVLSARAHGESGAVVSLLTEHHGRHAGYVRGAGSSKMRGTLEAGSVVSAAWQSRTEEGLGAWVLEQEHNTAAAFMDDPLRLGALLSACALCDAALPEREGHAGLFHGLLALFDMMDGEAWGAAYILWEIALLKELGFGLDFTRCAAGGDAGTLVYISPKSGCAVSAEKGEPYKDRLLPLPEFLKPERGEASDEEILKALQMTGHFLEHWVFTHHTQGVPEARLRFQERFGRSLKPLVSGAVAR